MVLVVVVNDTTGKKELRIVSNKARSGLRTACLIHKFIISYIFKSKNKTYVPPGPSAVDDSLASMVVVVGLNDAGKKVLRIVSCKTRIRLRTA